MQKLTVFFHRFCFSFIFFTSFASQADEQNQFEFSSIEPIVISGTGSIYPLKFVTDLNTFNSVSSASDGTDYLKTVPGFSAVRNGGTHGDPVLRGMFGSRLNILGNGTTILGACGSRMDAPASYLSAESYDKLTIIKGPESVIWGPGASAGTISFDRETPRFTQPDLKFKGTIFGGSWNRNDQSIDLSAGNQKVVARVMAYHSESKDYKDGNGLTIPSRWNKWNGDIVLTFFPDLDSSIELTAGSGDAEARYAGRGMDGSQFERKSIGLKFEKSFISERLEKIEAQIYENTVDHVMDNFSLRQPKANAMGMASNVDRTIVGGRFAATVKLAHNLQLITGMDSQQNQRRGRSGNIRNPYRDKPWVKSGLFSNTGVFGELTWRIEPSSRVIGGMRIDWAGAKDFRQHTSDTPPKFNPTNNQTRKNTLPSGFVRYERALQNIPINLYVGLGHVERFPDSWELFSPKFGPAGSVNAFEGLKPEQTTQLDFGGQYQTEEFELWMSAYVGHIKDYILFKYPPFGTMGGSSATQVNAKIFGAETGSAFRFASGWKIGGSLAYAGGINQRDHSALPQMPPLEARLNAGYEMGPWAINALWRVAAPQRRYALYEGNVAGKDFGPSAGFGIVALSGSYKINKGIQVSLGINNVFDKAYAEHLNLAGHAGFGYPATTPIAINEPGRMVWGQIGAKF